MNPLPAHSPRRAFWRTIFPLSLGIALWAGTLVGACVSSFTQQRTVTPVYHAAVADWFAGRALYARGDMHYFPQFVFLFLPFHLLPGPFGDILWRVLSAALLAWSVWALIRLLDSRPLDASWAAVIFALASFLSLRSCFSAMRNGQASVAFAAFTILAAVDLARARWRGASLWLTASLVAKPIGIVMMLLAAPAYRKLATRLLAGLAVFLLFPFLFGHAGYVLAQYGQSVRHLFSVSTTTENRFADLNGLLRALGIGLSGRASVLLRGCAALLAAAFYWWHARRKSEPDRSIFLLAVATTWLVLFNPMTEENGYVIVVPIVAVYALRFLFLDRRPASGWLLVCVSLLIGVVPDIYSKRYPDFGLWWRPLMILIFAAVLIATAGARPPTRTASESPS